MQGDQLRPTVLRNRHFLLLWSAQAISQTAQNVIIFALLIEVGRLSRSSTHASLIVLSFIVPAVVVGPVAGVFVDRSDKRRILWVTNLLRAGIVLAYMMIGSEWPMARALIAIYAISVLFSTISQFFAPAEAATIPLLVNRDQLPAANSLFNLTFTSSQVAGFAFFGPLLIKLTTLPTILVAVSLLYVAGTILVLFLPDLPRGRQPMTEEKLTVRLRTTWSEINDLWRFIAHQRVIARTIGDIAITSSIFLILGTLGVGLVSIVLGLSSSDLAYVLSAGGLGMLLGLWLAPRFVPLLANRNLIDAGLSAMGAAILGIALVDPLTRSILGESDPALRTTLTLVIVMLLAAVLGLASALVTVPAQTLLQQQSPPEMRGRVFATLFAFSSALSILPVLFTGILADLIGLQNVMAIIGLAILILVLSGHYQRLRPR